MENVETAKKKSRKSLKKRRKAKRKHNKVESTSLGVPEKSDVIIEYVPEPPNIKITDPNYRHFSKVFNTFKITAEAINNPKSLDKSNATEQNHNLSETKLPHNLHHVKEVPTFEENDDEDDLNKLTKNFKGTNNVGGIANQEPEKLSKRKWKQMHRISVSALKQYVKKPDVVEMYDVYAPDPKLLCYLKSIRNTVPVPRHWCYKRKYLAGKRGFLKPPFELPEFIQKTGITEMRQAIQDKEEHASLKSTMRNKIRPKMGKIDIDYQKLHDAFFKWQTKPKMTNHGDLYFEGERELQLGKELEIRLKDRKPGDLSEELREALGMPLGIGSDKIPPPWLIAMQRYGPPPSYPDQRIPGLNAPIPEGCSFGYHLGGWGKPPVDEFGRPLYGDVFNTHALEFRGAIIDEEVDKTPWGELESGSEDEGDDESSQDETTEDNTQQSLMIDKALMSDTTVLNNGLITPIEPGLITPSGLISTPVLIGPGGGTVSGISSSVLLAQTPEAALELRKRKIEREMEMGSEEQPTLYKIIPQKTVISGDVATQEGVLAGPIYDISAVVPSAKREKIAKDDDMKSGTSSSSNTATSTGKKYKEFKF